MENFHALYYQKPYIKEFDATVIACSKTERGYEIELSDTAFYPEGGGQPGDRGSLVAEGQPERTIRISDTQFAGERIVHIADGELAAGTKVHGVLDWVNRCDNMQGHSGEHILTGILAQTYGYENVGFHMGESFITIDFSGPLTDEQVLDAEQRANEIVRANLPIQESFPNTEELKTMQYRSKKELSGTVRIITIPGLDSCACCGTHVTATGEIGIDYGCKTAATCSNGDKLETKFTQQYAKKLATAQRAHKKKQARRINRKIKNKRADATHKFTSKLVKENRLIVAGNVKSSSFTSGKLAKSVYDANWFAINRQLEYKSRRAGCQFIVVDEKFSTQTCANCLQITNSSPKGVAGLGIREWICDCCGQLNDRDVNAAKNILRFGRETLAEGSPIL